MTYTLTLNRPMDEVRAELSAAIDVRANAIRARYQTPGVPYAEKLAEARAVMNGGDVADSPHIASDASRLNISLQDAARVVIQRAKDFRTISALIEYQRLWAKDAIRAATNERDARAVKIEGF